MKTVLKSIYYDCNIQLSLFKVCSYVKPNISQVLCYNNLIIFFLQN